MEKSLKGEILIKAINQVKQARPAQPEVAEAL
jgi:hypothetical protein